MKCPIKCPACDGVLLVEELASPTTTEYWKKTCDKTDHKFGCRYNSNTDEIITVYIFIKEDLIMAWNLRDKYMYQTDKMPGNFLRDQTLTIINKINIPYFEPDLSDYNKLIEKIKTYVTFS